MQRPHSAKTFKESIPAGCTTPSYASRISRLRASISAVFCSGLLAIPGQPDKFTNSMHTPVFGLASAASSKSILPQDHSNQESEGALAYPYGTKRVSARESFDSLIGLWVVEIFKSISTQNSHLVVQSLS
jgi:hypothetical protein